MIYFESEKHFEDLLFENQEVLPEHFGIHPEAKVARQVSLNQYGICDLLTIYEILRDDVGKHYYIEFIELKNTPIKNEHLIQCARYKTFFDNIQIDNGEIEFTCHLVGMKTFTESKGVDDLVFLCQAIDWLNVYETELDPWRGLQFSLVSGWHKGEKKKLLVPPTIVGALTGLWLFAILDNRMLVAMLGGFLVLYASYMLAVSMLGLPQLRCSQRWALPVGFFGSFFDTLFGGGGGTLVVIYINARGIGRSGFRATVAALWFTEMIARIGGYAWAGFYDAKTLWLFAALLPLMWAGTVVGERLGNRVGSETFREYSQ